MSNNLLFIREKDYGLQVSVYVAYGAVYSPPSPPFCLYKILQITNNTFYTKHLKKLVFI